jgi:hypothetical protein
LLQRRLVVTAILVAGLVCLFNNAPATAEASYLVALNEGPRTICTDSAQQPSVVGALKSGQEPENRCIDLTDGTSSDSRSSVSNSPLDAKFSETDAASNTIQTSHRSVKQPQEQLSPSQESTEELPIKYWGNSFSAKFHRPSCPFARAMNPAHVIFFHFRKDAIAQGQQPCRYCLPPYVRHVECQILPKQPQTIEGRPDAASQ